VSINDTNDATAPDGARLEGLTSGVRVRGLRNSGPVLVESDLTVARPSVLQGEVGL
jgi:hypothetical protein